MCGAAMMAFMCRNGWARHGDMAIGNRYHAAKVMKCGETAMDDKYKASLGLQYLYAW